MDKGAPVFLLRWPTYVEGEEIMYGLGTPFIWGGGVPSKRRLEWDDAQGPYNPVEWLADTYAVRPIHRPMNKYLDASVTWDHPDRIRRKKERRQIPMDLPEYFKCPSDCTAALWDAYTYTNPNADYDTPLRMWEWWGNSYAINCRWAYHYAEDHERRLWSILTDSGLTRGLLNSKSDTGAAEFVLFHEGRMDNGLHASWPRGYVEHAPLELVGWHKQMNAHAISFLDGHAQHRVLDLRYVDGPGWSLWPNRPWSAFWQAYEGN